MNDFPHLVLLDGSEPIEEIEDEEVMVDIEFDPLEDL
jgi:hypothetical protein